MTDNPIVEIVRGTKSLPNLPRILDDVAISLTAKESMAIVGRSGSGKSTLLSILGLLDTFDSGDYRFGGVDVSGLSQRDIDHFRGKELGFVFQRFALFPQLSAIENVMTPLRHSSRMSSRSMRAESLEALRSVGMEDAAKRVPRQLSGGEQQRVAIARALVQHPRLILADEPTGSLDIETGKAIVKLLRDRVGQDGAALIVVTHDLEVATQMDSIYRLDRGALLPETNARMMSGSP